MKYQNTKSRSEFNFSSSGLAITLSRPVSSIKNIVATTPSGLALLNTSLTQLDPWFITGFADGESNFSVLVSKKPRLKTG